MSEKKTILIIGIAGGLSQIVAKMIAKDFPHYKIIGIDGRPIKFNHNFSNIKSERMPFTRGKFENLFRKYRFNSVIHLGRVSHAKKSYSQNISSRLKQNIIRTKNILDLCLDNEVKNLVILSTFHVYGALSDNPVFISEDFPLRASLKHPELRDVVEMDIMCSSWMWKNRDKIKSVIFRPCNIIGPHINNAISLYLRNRYTPVPMDYNPIFQFIHELDMARIIYHALDNIPTGTYNVSGDGFISLEKAKKIIGTQGVSFPISLLSPLTGLIKKFGIDIPDYLLDYLKFSCLISNKELSKHLPESFFKYSIEESLKFVK